MSSPLTVHTLCESDYSEWDTLVAESPDGSIYANAGYLETLCGTAGGRFRIVVARRAGRIVGGVPLYEQDSRKGVFVGPRLLLYYLGPVLKRSQSKYPSQQTSFTLAALEALVSAVTQLRYAKVTLRARHTLADVRPFLAQGWSAWPTYSYLLPLRDIAGQWNLVEQNLRRLIERCTEQNVSHTEDDDFESFLRLHKLTMAHHNAAAYLPDSAFRRWFQILRASGHCRLFHARLPSGQSIGAQVVLLGDHPVSHTVSAAIDPARRQLGSAAFLRWRTFEWLARHGKAGNDLTDAALNSVTHFKSQLGGELVTNLVVASRGTFSWRARSVIEGAYGSARRLAGIVVRRLHHRGPA